MGRHRKVRRARRPARIRIVNHSFRDKSSEMNKIIPFIRLLLLLPHGIGFGLKRKFMVNIFNV